MLPLKLVWDREAAIAGGGRPTEPFAAFCGQLGVGWVILQAADPQAKGVLERSHRFLRSNFERWRRFANHLDFQDQFDSWCDRANRRVHRTIRAVPVERLAEEQTRMRALPDGLPDTDRRSVVRVPAQPYLRVDRNDYSAPCFPIHEPAATRTKVYGRSTVLLRSSQLLKQKRQAHARTGDRAEASNRELGTFVGVRRRCMG